MSDELLYKEAIINRKRVSSIIGILLCIVIAVAILYVCLNTKEYYTKIDNSKCLEMSNADGYGLKYEYYLEAFDMEGKGKEITFKTSRILKENAYIQVTYMPVRGVTKWLEVAQAELPEKVQHKYNNQE